jgi:glycosyltransferase involved in cell wall biosynthesis
VRLLFLNPIGRIGGAERVLLTAIAGVRRDLPSAEAHLVSLADGPLLAAARELGASVEVVPLSSGLGELGDSRIRGGRVGLAFRSLTYLPALVSHIRRLKSAIRAFNPDLIHSNGIKTHILSRFAVPPGVPVVWHLHDFYGLRSTAGWLLRRACKRVRVAIAISKAIASDAGAVLPGLRVEVVPNAVDLAHFAPGAGDGADLDHRAGLPVAPAGTVRVGLVATYARWKGQLTVLDAAAKLISEVPALPIRWYIIGGPIYQTAAQFTDAELRAAAESCGLGGHVGFVPFAADPAPVYRSLDVVLHASIQPEPFGLTVAEAMACGRPVVVSAGGGAKELFTDGIDALGVEPGNVGQLAEVVRRLVQAPLLRANLGTAARRTAAERFDAAQYGAKLYQLYRSVLP